MEPSYLHRCLALFEETMQDRHGWRPDYAGLEAALEPVRLRKRDFSFRDLETIQNGRFWDFRQFWRFPAESEIVREIDMADMSRLMQRLPLDEGESIARLHAALKYIENVSVILRFVYPDHYGIISPPVEKLLEVRRGSTEVETYVNYLRDIRDVRDHHGLKRAADADMALWVVQERVLSSYRDHDLLRAFRSDTWLLRRKAVNLLAELADVSDPIGLARALAEAHPSLAGLIAGFELERRLRAAHGASAGIALPDVVEDLAGGEPARRAGVEAAALRRGAGLRDRLAMPGGRASKAEILDLIDIAGRIAGPE